MVCQVLIFGFKIINLLYTLVLVYLVSLAKGDEIHKIFLRDVEDFQLDRRVPDDQERVYDLSEFYPDLRLSNSNGYNNGTMYSNNSNKLIRCELNQDFWVGKNNDPIKYCREKLKDKSFWKKIKDFFGF